jgi:hypothetical protein
VDKPSTAAKRLSHERQQKKKSNPLVESAKIIGGGLAGLAIGYLLICWISPNNDFLGFRGSKELRPAVTSGEVLSLEPSIEAPPARDVSPTPTTDQNAPPAADSNDIPAVAEQPASELTSVKAISIVEEPIEPATPIESDEQRLQRLTTERDEAQAKSHIDAALKAVEAIAAMTDGDALDRKLAFVARLLDSAETSHDTQRATEYLLRLLHEAVEANRKDLANRHTDQLMAGARRSSDADLVRWATLCVLTIQNM